MKNEEQKQLLSAYFDNEVSPEERAEIEQLLKSTHETQRSLDETEQLADLIRSLPKQSAPKSLSDTVLQQTVCGTSASPASTPATQIHSKSGRHYSWIVWGGCLLSTAALLFTAVYFIPSQQAEHSTAVANRNTSPDPLGSPSDFMTEGEFLGKPTTPAKLELNPADDVEMPPSLASRNLDPGITTKEMPHKMNDRTGTPMASASNTNGSGVGTDYATDRGLQRNMAVVSRKKNEFGRSQLKQKSFRNVNWKDVHVGDLFDYDDISNGEVTVVEVTVVDVQKAFGEVQMLLARNSIPDVTLNNNAYEKQGHHKNNGKVLTVKPHKKNAHHLGSRVALFVETSKVQLTSTLTALQKRELFLNMQPQTDQVASVDIKNQFASLKIDSIRSRRHLEYQQQEASRSPSHGFSSQDKKEKTPSLKGHPGENKKMKVNVDAQGDGESELDNSATTNKKRVMAQQRSSYQMVVNFNKPALFSSAMNSDAKKSGSQTVASGTSKLDSKAVSTNIAKVKKQHIAHGNKSSKKTLQPDKQNIKSAEEKKTAIAEAATPPLHPVGLKKNTDAKDDSKTFSGKGEINHRYQKTVRVLFVFKTIAKPVQ